MGRPTDNPKDKTLFIRLDNESSEALEAYCEQERVTKAEAARRGIKKLKDDLKKWKEAALTHQSNRHFPPNRQMP